MNPYGILGLPLESEPQDRANLGAHAFAPDDESKGR